MQKETGNPDTTGPVVSVLYKDILRYSGQVKTTTPKRDSLIWRMLDGIAWHSWRSRLESWVETTVRSIFQRSEKD